MLNLVLRDGKPVGLTRKLNLNTNNTDTDIDTDTDTEKT